MKPLKYNMMWSRDNNGLLAIRVSIAPRERSNFRFQENALRIIIKKTGVKCGLQLFSLPWCCESLCTWINYGHGHSVRAPPCDWNELHMKSKIFSKKPRHPLYYRLYIYYRYIIWLLIIFISTVIFNNCCLPLNDSSSKSR